MSGDDACVLAHPEQERGLSGSQKMDADKEQPGNDSAHAIALAGEAELVEHVGPWEPRPVVGTEATGEDDDAEVGEIQRFGRAGSECSRHVDWRQIKSMVRRVPLDQTHQLAEALICPVGTLLQILRKVGQAALNPQEVPSEDDSHSLERTKVQVVAGVGRVSTVWSKNPAWASHHTMSWLPSRRGTQGALPQARTTSRPASRYSSLICAPDWPLPTTSTLPGGRALAFR